MPTKCLHRRAIFPYCVRNYSVQSELIEEPIQIVTTSYSHTGSTDDDDDDDDNFINP